MVLKNKIFNVALFLSVLPALNLYVNNVGSIEIVGLYCLPRNVDS